MKIFIDWLKKAITKIEHDNELYVGNQFSTKFDIYFFNVGTDTDWFPTLTQLAPTGREAGPFSADSDSFTTTTIDNVTYLTVTFTMGTGYAFIKGVSSFFLYENRITTPNPTKSVIGKFIVTLNKSDNGYFLDDPEFNPKVKEYVDKYSQLRFGGEASTSVIEALETNQGVWLATDTGYYWYWDYDNNEYVRGNLFQAVSVADGAITTAKIADGAVTTAKIPQGAITDTKLAGPLALKINNSVQKGENNPTVNPNVHTNIINSNSMESDTDESYGSQIDLSLDKAIVGHSTYSNSTTKYSKVEFDEYHDNTDNDDYPRTVIETKYEYDSTPESSKIKVLKDLIELLSGGKITIQADDDIEIKTDSAHTIIIRGCVDFYDDIWAHNSYITGQDIFAERSLYENNKRVATKEYVQQREAYLQAQIDASGLTPSDIADNLNTNDSTKVLSAAQGVVLKGFIDNINTLLQCDDTTLDEIQEIVDYIKNNKSLIDGITTSKVNVSDIINNLTSTATNKPLSANQGKVLKDTLDSVQASISALTSNKQDKIDSTHKLNADLVAENSSRVFVTPTQKQQIGTNTSDISSLDQRVTTLENNPTSNVSGTNDGTNWTSITIGNETYAIPSGSSGGSGSGETLKLIRLSAVWVDEVYIGMRGTDFETVLSQLSQQMGTTITEDMIPTLWANASDYEKLSVVYYLTLGKLFASWGAKDVLAFTPTLTEIDDTTAVTSISLSYLNSSNQIATQSTLNDIASSTISITTIGGGNGGTTPSANGETLVSITFTNLDVRNMDSSNELIYDMHIFCTKTRWDSFVALANTTFGYNITYENVGTFFTNANNQGQTMLIGYLLMDNFDKKILPQSYICKQETLGGVGSTDYKVFTGGETFVQDGVEFLWNLKFTGFPTDVLIDNVDRNDTPYATSNTTVTASEFTSSVGGSSASSGAYYEIKTNDIAFYEENGTLVNSETTNNFTITFSEGAFEACLQERINPSLTQLGMPTISTINEFVALMNQICTETESSSSNKAYNLFVMISGYARMFINNGLIEVFYDRLVHLYSVSEFYTIALYDNDGDTIDQPYGISATWTLSQYGTSGGSSTSESYYKIVLEDEDNSMQYGLNIFLTPTQFSDILTAINTQMGTSLSTPQDLITFYDSVKGDSNYYDQCRLLFTSMCLESKKSNCASRVIVYVSDNEVGEFEIVGATLPQRNLLVLGLENNLLFNSTSQIGFTSSSTLTITEQNNQKI